jgi:hypothetical protein
MGQRRSTHSPSREAAKTRSMLDNTSPRNSIDRLGRDMPQRSPAAEALEQLGQNGANRLEPMPSVAPCSAKQGYAVTGG